MAATVAANLNQSFGDIPLATKKYLQGANKTAVIDEAFEKFEVGVLSVLS